MRVRVQSSQGPETERRAAPARSQCSARRTRSAHMQIIIAYYMIDMNVVTRHTHTLTLQHTRLRTCACVRAPMNHRAACSERFMRASDTLCANEPERMDAADTVRPPRSRAGRVGPTDGHTTTSTTYRTRPECSSRSNRSADRQSAADSPVRCSAIQVGERCSEGFFVCTYIQF